MPANPIPKRRYADLAKQIRIILQAQNILLSVPYDKSSAQLAGPRPSPELIAQKQAQLRRNPTLAMIPAPDQAASASRP